MESFRRHIYDLNQWMLSSTESCWIYKASVYVIVSEEGKHWNRTHLEMRHICFEKCSLLNIPHWPPYAHTPLQLRCILHESRSVPYGGNSHAELHACIHVFLFKHHLHLFPRLPARTSAPFSPMHPPFPPPCHIISCQHDKTQDNLQSSWPLFDSGLVRDAVQAENGLMGGKRRQSVSGMWPECMKTTRLLHYPLCHILFHISNWLWGSFGCETCRIMHCAEMDK